jgi:cytochrome c2
LRKRFVLWILAGTLVACARATPSPTPVPVSAAESVDVETLRAQFAALPQGNAETGEKTFTSAGCSACHSLQASVQIVGPSLAGVAARAGQRVPDYAAGLYVYESIAYPNAHIVEGFQPGLMPTTFAAVLQPQDLADLIAFLMTLK